MVETPGLGTKADEPWFKKQFVGKTNADKIKVGKDGGTIDAITAATISSRAVCVGVKKVADMYKTDLDNIKNINPGSEVKSDTKSVETDAYTSATSSDKTYDPELDKSEGKGVSE